MTFAMDGYSGSGMSDSSVCFFSSASAPPDGGDSDFSGILSGRAEDDMGSGKASSLSSASTWCASSWFFVYGKLSCEDEGVVVDII